MTEVRVRFAPSPTGFLHVGGLRTALFNYLFAAQNNGKLILRIEDTDQTRKVAGGEENLIRSLDWAGLKFDEGSHVGGDFGPYVQSERLDIYQKYAHQLLDQGDAYYCFCTEEDLQKMREDQMARGEDTRYDGRCRKLSAGEVQQKRDDGQPSVVRVKIDRSRSEFLIKDLVRGEVSFNPEQIDDQILIKSDGFPTYHLAAVVDDHLMKVSHVIRGEEWLSSTPKHVQLYEYLGWDLPQFAHLPLLLNPDRSKLSKRQGDVATEDYREKGFLPECMVNFVALLGWHTHDDQEIFSMEELVQSFSMDRVQKSGAVFDIDKLKWMNQQYIKENPLDELHDLLKPYLPDYAKNAVEADLKKMIETVRNSLVTLPDIARLLDLFFLPDIELKDEELLARVKSDDAQSVYQSFIRLAEQQPDLNRDNFGQIMKSVQKETGIKGKNLWGPIRLAITLMEHGPDLTSVIDIFGKEKCLNMVRKVLI